MSNYDDPKNLPQGSPKISEVFTDRALDIIETSIGESGIKVYEQLLRVIGDALQRTNYLLYSAGQVTWDGANLWFTNTGSSGGTAANILFRFLQTEDIHENGIDPITGKDNVPSPRTITLTLTGNAAAPSTTEFQSIPMLSGDVLYLELDRNTLLSSSGNIVVTNAVNGGSGSTGATLRKVNISTGLPALTSDYTQPLGSQSNTLIIPLATRIDSTVGATTYHDLWWIPHGIRWPLGITSTVGAVIVDGMEAYASLIVPRQYSLANALTLLAPTGGIILLDTSITIPSSTNLTIPSGVTILGRSMLDPSQPGATTITLGSNSSLVMSDRTKLFMIGIITDTSSGVLSNYQAVQMTGGSEIRDCNFQVNTASNVTYHGSAIGVTGSQNRIYNCRFTNLGSATYRVGIEYISGSNNADIDSQFT